MMFAVHAHRRRIAALTAALALLAAQAFGLAHRVAHGAEPAAAPAHVSAPEVCDHAHEPGQGLAALFDHHHDEGSVECRLIDQAGHADVLPTGALPVLALGTSADAALPCPLSAARTTRPQPYQARAPPLLLA
jgi:hypothetical protein